LKVYRCPNCESRISSKVIFVKSVTCDSCGKKVKVSDAIGMAFVVPTFLAAGLSYRLENYYIIGCTLVFSVVLIAMIAPNHIKLVNK